MRKFKQYLCLILIIASSCSVLAEQPETQTITSKKYNCLYQCSDGFPLQLNQADGDNVVAKVYELSTTLDCEFPNGDAVCSGVDMLDTKFTAEKAVIDEVTQKCGKQKPIMLMCAVI